jgi:hypothetical protein
MARDIACHCRHPTYRQLIRICASDQAERVGARDRLGKRASMIATPD